jgi:hypothetical protein
MKDVGAKNFSSTTLLARFGDDDIIVFGRETNSEQGACTAMQPDKKEPKTLLSGLT